MKYEVNRVTLVGNVGEVPRVTEHDGEAFVAIFPWQPINSGRTRKGRKYRKQNGTRSYICLEHLFRKLFSNEYWIESGEIL